MPLQTSLTGSYPPIFSPYNPIHLLPEEEQDQLVKASIERAVQDQLELGIDVLVDGQVRGDIVMLFARKMPGFNWNKVPPCVVGKIRPANDPITLADYLFAHTLAPHKPLKAHVTGPLSMSRGIDVDENAPYNGQDDIKLFKDLAAALADEAQALVEAGAEIVQIDEPVLQDGFDLDLAFKFMDFIVQRAGIPFPALHACGDVTLILDDILERAPVRMVSIEGNWLDSPQLLHIRHEFLERTDKQIGLGCINPTDGEVVGADRLKRRLKSMAQRLGEDRIWASMPNCGLRYTQHMLAYNKVKAMVEAAHSV